MPVCLTCRTRDQLTISFIIRGLRGQKSLFPSSGNSRSPSDLRGERKTQNALDNFVYPLYAARVADVQTLLYALTRTIHAVTWTECCFPEAFYFVQVAPILPWQLLLLWMHANAHKQSYVLWGGEVYGRKFSKW